MNDAKIIAVTQPLIKSQNTQGGSWILTKGDWTQKDKVTTGPYMSAEEFLAYTARVSNPSNQNNTLTAPKLLKYLIKHKHWSPFEMVSITMEINTTRDISHQIIRHRSFSFQEFSQRYADPTKDMQFVTREARLQDKKNRQNSIETDDAELQERWKNNQDNITKIAQLYYKDAIEWGIAKEQARSLLPEGLTSTRLYMAGTLRSWIHYIDVRAEEGTQKEHREVALAARDEILNHFPSLNDYWYSAPAEIRKEAIIEQLSKRALVEILVMSKLTPEQVAKIKEQYKNADRDYLKNMQHILGKEEGLRQYNEIMERERKHREQDLSN